MREKPKTMVKYALSENGKALGNRGPFHDSPCGPSTCHQAFRTDYCWIMNPATEDSYPLAGAARELELAFRHEFPKDSR